MTLARWIEAGIAIPAWCVMAAAVWSASGEGSFPWWGLLAFVAFFTVWVDRFLSDERELLNG